MKRNLPLTWRDLWMLQAIHIAKFKGAAAELDSLIGTADWLDHSIPTFAEINNAIYNLEQAGLLVQKDRVLKLGKSARLFFREFAAFYPLKQFEALCSRLSVLRPPVSGDPNLLTASETFLSEEEYTQAVEAYVQRSVERNGF